MQSRASIAFAGTAYLRGDGPARERPLLLLNEEEVAAELASAVDTHKAAASASTGAFAPPLDELREIGRVDRDAASRDADDGQLTGRDDRAKGAKRDGEPTLPP